MRNFDGLDRVGKPLQPGGKCKSSGAVAQQAVAPENRCDELPMLTKKGKVVNKVRPVGQRGGGQEGGACKGLLHQ